MCDGANLIEALSPEDRTELAEAVAAVPYPEGNFWRAEMPGSTVHVVGTVHIPDPRLQPMADRAAEYLAGADLLILEVTSDSETEMMRMMAERPHLAFLTEGPTLIDLLDEDSWARLSDELSSRGIPPFMAAKYRPWLLFATLSVPACAFDALMAGEPGLDAQIEAEALARDIEIATLDEIEDVMAIMNQGTLEEQVELLKMAVLPADDPEDLMTTTLHSYFAGRHRELWEFGRMSAEREYDGNADAVFEDFEEGLLHGRNRAWEDKIVDMVAGRDAMIAVGAAHLSGETGVLKALERMGYRLTRL